MPPYADLAEALSDATWGAYSFLMIRDGVVSRWTFGVDPYSQDTVCPAWDVRPADWTVN